HTGVQRPCHYTQCLATIPSALSTARPDTPGRLGRCGFRRGAAAQPAGENENARMDEARQPHARAPDTPLPPGNGHSERPLSPYRPHGTDLSQHGKAVGEK